MSKRTQRRDCPAAGKPIEAFECAIGRHVTYNCPETCSFNHFSTQNYDAFLEIEQSADAKFVHWLFDQAPIAAQIAEINARTPGDEPSSEFFHSLAWLAVYQKNPDGDTWLEKMSRQGFPGASRDEQLVLRGKMRMRPVIVEVHRILDDRRIEVVDLLDPDKCPFLLVDRALAGVAVRFGTHALHAFPLPHFHRPYGISYTIPTMPPLDTEEIVREIICHFGGGVEAASMRTWLMEHYLQFDKALSAVALARRRAMFNQLDAQFGKAVYELTLSFEDCKKRLTEVPQIEEDSLSPAEQAEGFLEGRVWFASLEDPEHTTIGEGATLGRILLGKTHWRLDCAGGSRLDRLRAKFESLMGARLRFVAERRDDIAAQLRLKDPDYDQSLVPPALIRDPQELSVGFSRVRAQDKKQLQDIEADYKANLHKQWLEEPVPALSGKTPRQATTDPALRPVLVRLMKEQIRSQDALSLETGQTEDLNWMVRELGLTEILFDPPPPRPRVERTADFADEEDLFESEYPEYADWPDPEPLPDRPLTKEESLARLEMALTSFSTMTAAFDYLYGMGYALFDDLRELAGDILSDREHQFLAPILSVLVLCYAPKGTRPPEVDFEDLSQAFSRAVFDMDAAGVDFDRHVEEWLSASRQPELLMVFLNLALQLIDGAPKELRPRKSSRPKFAFILRVLNDELDRVMREGH